MEPDYSNYSRKELLEAYESVDRSVYPCRFEKIESELKKYKTMEPTGTIVGQFQNYVFTGVSLLTAYFHRSRSPNNIDADHLITSIAITQ
jgi:hypothetical protein